MAEFETAEHWVCLMARFREQVVYRLSNYCGVVLNELLCLDGKVIDKQFLGEGSLRHAVREYMAHYHAERNHQGMGNRLLKPVTTAPSLRQGSVNQRQRLGGMLNYYYREAA
ncbi:MAG: hypothetical protein ACYCP0_08180 [Acidiferrobacteraceae bacterium]